MSTQGILVLRTSVKQNMRFYGAYYTQGLIQDIHEITGGL